MSLATDREISEYTLSTSIRLALALVLAAYQQSEDVIFWPYYVGP